MTWSTAIPLLMLLTSLVPAVVIFFLSEDRVRTRIVVNMSGVTLKLGLIVLMLWGVFLEYKYEFSFAMLPGATFVLRADALAMFFVSLSGLLWFLTTVYAIAYLEGSPHRSRFFGFFSLCVSATVGLALAGNLFTFIIFYELLTLSTYPLVVHRQTETSRRAGRIYLAYTLGGGAMLLAGAAWLHALVPTVEFNDGASLSALGPEYDGTLRLLFFILIAGAGAKAALIPLHGWLPRAMVAPAPVSALLHAVAVVKAGAFGIVRIVYDIFGIDRAQSLGVMLPLSIWASATIVYGSVRALFQDDLKRRLAWSTVSQVAYIALGVSILGPSSTIGGVVHLVHQGLMKITLFFCAGNVAESLGLHKISEMGGVGRRMPWTMGAFTVAALGMIGMPPLCGFISKWYLSAGAIEASQHWVLLVLAASTALNAAYFLPVIYIAWFGKPHGQPVSNAIAAKAEARWGLLLPPLVTAALAVVVGLFAGAPQSPLQWAAMIAERAYGRVVIDRGLSGLPLMLDAGHLLMLATLVVPLVLACCLLMRLRSSRFIAMVSIAALPAFATALLVETGTQVELRWLLLHMHLGVDATGKVFLIFTSLLWLAAGVYAKGYLAHDAAAPRFFLFFLLAMTGNLGLVLAQDMASFYLFFALMSFASYPLVVHAADEAALHAGRVYIKLVVFGEIALFAGIAMAAVATDSLLFYQPKASLMDAAAPHLIIGLILMGFAIKAGIIPLHVWLPLAHPAAPTPASAVLSGAMIKAGLLGWMRFLPMGEVALPGWGELCLIVGLMTAFVGVAVGVTQRNPKAALAYSSISQMGLLMVALGGGFLTPTSWPTIATAMGIYALHHGLSKGCLFLSVGIAPAASAIGWRRWLVRIGLVFPALVLAGAPLMIGAVGKGAIKNALASLPESWALALGWLLPLASVGTTLLMARFLYLIWPRENMPSHPASKSAWIAWAALLAAVLLTPWWVPDYAPTGGTSLLLSTITWANLLPVSFGAILAWLTWRYRLRRQSPALSIPAGDVLGLWTQMQQSVAGLTRRLTSCWPSAIARFLARYSGPPRALIDVAGWRHHVQRGEAALGQGSWTALFLLIAVLACWTAWFMSS